MSYANLSRGDIYVLVTDVVQGNPGAMTVVQRLMSLPTWPQLLHHCKTRGLVGSALWRVVKDQYGHDWRRFVADQMAQMARCN